MVTTAANEADKAYKKYLKFPVPNDTNKKIKGKRMRIIIPIIFNKGDII